MNWKLILLTFCFLLYCLDVYGIGKVAGAHINQPEAATATSDTLTDPAYSNSAFNQPGEAQSGTEQEYPSEATESPVAAPYVPTDQSHQPDPIVVPTTTVQFHSVQSPIVQPITVQPYQVTAPSIELPTYQPVALPTFDTTSHYSVPQVPKHCTTVIGPGRSEPYTYCY